MFTRQQPVDPQRLTPRQAARIITQAGHKITPATVAADIAAGCPTNEDNTIDLTTYTAWLIAKAWEANS